MLAGLVLDVFCKRYFLRDCFRWSPACSKFVTKDSALLRTTHAMLVIYIPRDFLSASGDHQHALKDMAEAHAKEIREISEFWDPQVGDLA